MGVASSSLFDFKSFIISVVATTPASLNSIKRSNSLSCSSSRLGVVNSVRKRAPKLTLGGGASAGSFFRLNMLNMGGGCGELRAPI